MSLKHSFPFDRRRVINLAQQNLLYIELLVARFAKLQDLIEAKNY